MSGKAKLETQIAIRLPDDLITRYDELAKKASVPRTYLIRQAMMKYINEIPGVNFLQSIDETDSEKTEEKYSIKLSILENSEKIIIISTIDPEGKPDKIIKANNNFFHFLKYDETDFDRVRVENIFNKEFIDEFKNLGVYEVIQKRETIKTKNGKSFTLLTAVKKILLNNEDNYLIIIQNSTAEDELEYFKKEYERLNDENNKIREEYEKLIESYHETLNIINANRYSSIFSREYRELLKKEVRR